MPHDPMTAASRLKFLQEQKRIGNAIVREAARERGYKLHPKIDAARTQKEQKDG